MRTAYTNLNIRFAIDDIHIHALNITYERFTRTIPSHSHGNGCYEIHHIPCGCGTLKVNGQYYDIVPGTLYVTGPHVEHAQTPLLHDPMQEYCVYLKLQGASRPKSPSSVMDTFIATPFWFGKDTQDIHSLMKKLFGELECRYLGYEHQLRLLLSQLLICIVRNQGLRFAPGTVLRENNLADSTSIIIEEYFLYEYVSLSLKGLADRLKLSTRQTQRLLLEYYGKSFQQKKTEARMSAATILLSDRNRSISSIAEALGYCSSEHFSSAFRNYYQTSPTEYRKQLV